LNIWYVSQGIRESGKKSLKTAIIAAHTEAGVVAVLAQLNGKKMFVDINGADIKPCGKAKIVVEEGVISLITE
jgi:hypothetical protein